MAQAQLMMALAPAITEGVKQSAETQRLLLQKTSEGVATAYKDPEQAKKFGTMVVSPTIETAGKYIQKTVSAIGDIPSGVVSKGSVLVEKTSEGVIKSIKGLVNINKALEQGYSGQYDGSDTKEEDEAAYVSFGKESVQRHDNEQFNNIKSSSMSLGLYDLTPEDINQYKTASQPIDIEENEESGTRGSYDNSPNTLDITKYIMPGTKKEGGNDGLSNYFSLDTAIMILIIIFVIVITAWYFKRDDTSHKTVIYSGTIVLALIIWKFISKFWNF